MLLPAEHRPARLQLLLHPLHLLLPHPLRTYGIVRHAARP